MVKNSFVVGSYQMPSEHITIEPPLEPSSDVSFFTTHPDLGIFIDIWGWGGGGWGLIIFRGSSIISIIYIYWTKHRQMEGGLRKYPSSLSISLSDGEENKICKSLVSCLDSGEKSQWMTAKFRF